MSEVRICDRCERRYWVSETREVTLEFPDGDGNIIDAVDKVLCDDCCADAEDEGYL